jgi:ribosomal protein L37AE/L43A
MIDWEQHDKDQAAERDKREGYRSADYTGNECEHCGRNRVMNCQNGKHICEKCGWDNDAHEYSDYLSG